jgi:aspartate/methionine/tyrosine aminotransferase
MNCLAEELNSLLNGTIAGRLLSNLGRRLYFPRGIIAQSAEAKNLALTANATIGMVYTEGEPIILSAIADSLPGLKSGEIVAYAPTAGVEKVRKAWRDGLLKKNPSITSHKISLPAVVPGLTAGLSYIADMFLDEGRPVIASDPCWDNYGLIFETRRGGILRGIPFVGLGPGLNLAGIEQTVREAAKTGTVRIVLNFPNNPSGYSPTLAEEEALVSLLQEAADGGADVLVICDDAYFGLFYEEDIGKESLFVRFANLHERILAVKIDGPIKEDFIWGLRMGFVTFGSKGLKENHYDALVKKLMGAIRSSVSCANTPAQHLLLKLMEDPRTDAEKERFREMLRRRYNAVKIFIKEHPAHPALSPLPFNSGYFMSFRCAGINAETLRLELLSKHGIGTISLGDRILRIAFSSVEEEKIPAVYQTIYNTASELTKNLNR